MFFPCNQLCCGGSYDDKQQQELSSFSVNLDRRTGGFRGTIKVENPFHLGEFVERTYTTGRIRRGQSGVEFAFVGLGSDSPNNASREHALDPATAPNQYPGVNLTRVNSGVYFPAKDEDIKAAKAAGKHIPAAKAYVLMPFKDKATASTTPHVVELTAWEPKAKDDAPANGDTEKAVTWYGGSAVIFDAQAYLANSKKHGAASHEDGALDNADWHGSGAPEPSAEDGSKARKRAGRRAQDAQLPEEPTPTEG